MAVKVVLAHVAEGAKLNAPIAQDVPEDVADVILAVQAALLIAQMNVVDVVVAQEVVAQHAQDVILLAKLGAQMLVQPHALLLANKTAMLLVAIAVKE